MYPVQLSRYAPLPLRAGREPTAAGRIRLHRRTEHRPGPYEPVEAVENTHRPRSKAGQGGATVAQRSVTVLSVPKLRGGPPRPTTAAHAPHDGRG